jgi:hypothetical protein
VWDGETYPSFHRTQRDEAALENSNVESLLSEPTNFRFGSKAPVQHCRKPTLPSVVYQDVVTVSKGRG